MRLYIICVSNLILKIKLKLALHSTNHFVDRTIP